MTVFARLRAFARRWKYSLALLVLAALLGYVAWGLSGLLAASVGFIIGSVLGAWVPEFGAELWRRLSGAVERARQRVRKWWLLR